MTWIGQPTWQPLPFGGGGALNSILNVTAAAAALATNTHVAPSNVTEPALL